MELERVSRNPGRCLIAVIETTCFGEEIVARLGLSLDFDIGQIHIRREGLLEALARDEGGRCSSEDGDGKLHGCFFCCAVFDCGLLVVVEITRGNYEHMVGCNSNRVHEG